MDKNHAYPCAATDLKACGDLWRFSRLRQAKFLNNIVEQDYRRLKHLIRPGLGFGGFHTARRPLMGHEAMTLVRKGQVRAISGCEMPTEASFVAKLF